MLFFSLELSTYFVHYWRLTLIIFMLKLITNMIIVVTEKQWSKLLASNKWNNVELRDTRYNQIIHMVSAANGAAEFYSTEVIFFLRNAQKNGSQK